MEEIASVSVCVPLLSSVACEQTTGEATGDWSLQQKIKTSICQGLDRMGRMASWRRKRRHTQMGSSGGNGEKGRGQTKSKNRNLKRKGGESTAETAQRQNGGLDILHIWT
ncbi:hypothetical protein J3458_002744 [Metarhizium acridum]|uniref:uncharacterized protein n=1 Tax=Metarhizium acridum TaxID=92637 RepID=UPI001C6CAEF9|nr:hypothetical protein J3458_002744 [Metarhizium acridum]